MYKLIANPLGPVNVALNLETNTSFPFATRKRLVVKLKKP